jgi:hypothetical protein
MFQTPMITASIMTVVRLGFRQMFRQAIWRYMGKNLLNSYVKFKYISI